MSELNIETTQNVTIAYEPAPTSKRVFAIIIDYIIIAAVAAILFGIFPDMPYAARLAILIVLLMYDLLFELFMHGQTPGKIAMKIRVLTLSGDTPGFVAYFLRWIFRLIEGVTSFGFIAFITASVSTKGQRLGDIAAGTCVVSLQANTELDDLVYIRVPNNYQVQYPQVVKLTDEDIQTLKEVIERADDNISEKVRADLLEYAQNVVIKKLDIQTKTVLSPRKFLETILTDYTAMSLKR